MNCPHRGGGRGVCPSCKAKHRERRAKAFDRRVHGVLARIARCTHLRAERLDLNWCDLCGAHRDRGDCFIGPGFPGRWCTALYPGEAKALDRAGDLVGGPVEPSGDDSEQKNVHPIKSRT